MPDIQSEAGPGDTAAFGSHTIELYSLPEKRSLPEPGPDTDDMSTQSYRTEEYSRNQARTPSQNSLPSIV